MPEYQLEIKQVVDYPRCRIYRQFIQNLIGDRSIRVNGSSGLFYYTVLCSYANFRTSYRRIDGISYTVYPGEWICTLKELSDWFRTRFHHQAVKILEDLQERHLISFLLIDRGHAVKYKIRGWRQHNTVLEYNCPCQKETGFFFLPVATAAEMVGNGKCSEMDALLDLWISAVYNDEQVNGSGAGPVVYMRNGSGNPLVTYAELAVRWGISKASVGRLLKKLSAAGHISLLSFPGRYGSVIYLQNYLSTMFQISDVMIDKEEVAMSLNIKIELPAEDSTQDASVIRQEISVSEELSSVSKAHMEIMVGKVVEFLSAQGILCFGCSKIKYKLYPLSDACGEGLRGISDTTERLGFSVCCRDVRLYQFEIQISPVKNKKKEGE